MQACCTIIFNDSANKVIVWASGRSWLNFTKLPLIVPSLQNNDRDRVFLGAKSVKFNHLFYVR